MSQDTKPPVIGAPVHYVGNYGACNAAIITEIDPSSFKVSLIVFNPTSILLDFEVEFSPHEHSEGTWHWAEEV